MTPKEIQEKLLKSGLEHGMCDKFTDILSGRELTIDEMCELYHRGLDFCIEKNWPTPELVDEFSDAELNRNGIYYDSVGVTSDSQPNIVVNGDSDMTIKVKPYGVARISVRDNSKVSLVLGDNSYTYISVYDNAEVSIAYKGVKARIGVSLFSGTITDESRFDNIHRK